MNHIVPIADFASCHAKLQGGGRVVIPADYRKALHLSEGEDMVMRLEDGEIRIYSLQQAVKRAQQFAQKYMKSQGSIVDELIAERRLEAKRELE